MAHNRIKRYEILLDFFAQKVLESVAAEEKQVLTGLFTELLVFDLYLREDLKARPSFSKDSPNKNQLKELYAGYQTGRNQIHIEPFRFDVEASAITGQVIKKECAVIFDYGSRDPLNKAAKTTVIEL
jgi:hypothetical protein